MENVGPAIKSARMSANGLKAARKRIGLTQEQQAENEFLMMERSGLDPRDLCAAAGKVKRAYLEQGDEVKFQTWDAREYSACARARRM